MLYEYHALFTVLTNIEKWASMSTRWTSQELTDEYISIKNDEFKQMINFISIYSDMVLSNPSPIWE